MPPCVTLVQASAIALKASGFWLTPDQRRIFHASFCDDIRRVDKELLLSGTYLVSELSFVIIKSLSIATGKVLDDDTIDEIHRDILYMAEELNVRVLSERERKNIRSAMYPSCIEVRVNSACEISQVIHVSSNHDHDSSDEDVALLDQSTHDIVIIDDNATKSDSEVSERSRHSMPSSSQPTGKRRARRYVRVCRIRHSIRVSNTAGRMRKSLSEPRTATSSSGTFVARTIHHSSRSQSETDLPRSDHKHFKRKSALEVQSSSVGNSHFSMTSPCGVRLSRRTSHVRKRHIRFLIAGSLLVFLAWIFKQVYEHWDAKPPDISSDGGVQPLPTSIS